MDLATKASNSRPEPYSDSLMVQPEIAAVIADALGNLATGATVFFASGAVLLAWDNTTLGDAGLRAAGVAGAVTLLKMAAMSKPLMFWLEVALNRDIDADGYIGEPDKPKPITALPSSNWAEEAYSAAVKLWEYTHAQITAAERDGNKLRGKPWARRKGHGLSQDEWETAIDVWVSGGLIKTRDARTLETKSIKRGLDFIDGGMVALDFMRSNGRSWVPK
ncbi:MAG: hypothetical protein GWN93_06775 [Deltaproteobacteria bacterium]|nr:hypothetical protein [Deltaproteobacteria bacterium]